MPRVSIFWQNTPEHQILQFGEGEIRFRRTMKQESLTLAFPSCCVNPEGQQGFKLFSRWQKPFWKKISYSEALLMGAMSPEKESLTRSGTRSCCSLKKQQKTGLTQQLYRWTLFWPWDVRASGWRRELAVLVTRVWSVTFAQWQRVLCDSLFLLASCYY